MRTTTEAANKTIAATTSKKEPNLQRRMRKCGGKWNRERNSRRKIKPKVIIIYKLGEGPYADILRRVKADPELINLGDNVSRIRRSQKGDLMLELKKSKDITADKFLSQIRKSLREEAVIKASGLEKTIICKNIDEITMKDEVRKALEKQFDLAGLQESAVKTLGKANSNC